jgi:hypothetical protein
MTKPQSKTKSRSKPKSSPKSSLEDSPVHLVISPLGKDPVSETYESTPEGLAQLVDKLKDMVAEDSDSFVYVIQGERWSFTKGPSRYLVNGNTRVALFDEETPDIQEDGFLGSPVEPALVDTSSQATSGSSLQPVVAKDEDFEDDDYFSNEPDYDESLDAEVG